MIIAFSPSIAAYADSPSDDVLAAAENGLPAFLGAIPSDELEHYGFNSQQELSDATLGDPYEVFTMTNDAIKAYQAGTRLSGLLSKTGLWYFLVMVGGEPRTILTVASVNGKWEAVDIGGLALPQNLVKAGKNMSSVMATKGATAYTTRFVRVFSVYADFMAVESEKEDYLVPVMANPKAFGVNNLQPYSLDEVIPQIGATLD